MRKKKDNRSQLTLTHSDNPKTIILLSDIIEQKVRKEKELAYYQKQLVELQEKIHFLSKEVDLTNMIIELIERDNVVDISVERRNIPAKIEKSE